MRTLATIIAPFFLFGCNSNIEATQQISYSDDGCYFRVQKDPAVTFVDPSHYASVFVSVMRRYQNQVYDKRPFAYEDSFYFHAMCSDEIIDNLLDQGFVLTEMNAEGYAAHMLAWDQRTLQPR